MRSLKKMWGWPPGLRVGVVLLFAMVVFVLAAPLFGSAVRQDFTHGLTADGFPVGLSSRYPLGTDTLGRSMLARLAYGGRMSLLVAMIANVTSMSLGALVGMLAGFYRGPAESFLMRFTDVFLAVPYVLAAFVLAAVFPPGIGRVIVIITVLFWAYPARLVYGEVVRLRRRGFVEAAEAAGSRGTATMRKHVLPHILPLILSYAPLNAAAAIMFEATLSYLGAGINLPAASWGNMISDGQNALSYAPRLFLEPAIMLAVAIMAFLLIGEGLKAGNRAVTRSSWLDV